VSQAAGNSVPRGGSAALSGGWIDSHCHLQDRYRPAGTEVLAALAEAADVGVRGIICVGTDADTSRQAVALASAVRAAGRAGGEGEGEPARLAAGFGAWATVGLHPHEASSGVAEVETTLREVLEQPPGLVVAVGECGLDYHYDHSPRAAQREAFEAQAALALRLGLALVVHCRDAWDDTFDVLRASGPPERTILHCFTGGPAEARRFLDLGAFLSFSGIVTFKGAQNVRDAAALCPLDRLLVETDAPFLAPVPHRGKENRPAWVVEVGEAVAGIRGCGPAALAESSTAATRSAFALS
jgi:TatD DNase family protein